jgi:hypothetical protein
VKPLNTFCKAAAVMSSFLLAAGFVGYRAGAFVWLTEPSTHSSEQRHGQIPEKTPANEPPWKYKWTPNATEGRVSEPAQKRTIIYGTKAPVGLLDPIPGNSDILADEVVVVDALSQSPPPQPTQQPRPIMNSTKYAPVFVSPTLQWAVPNTVLDGPPAIPPTSPMPKPEK